MLRLLLFVFALAGAPYDAHAASDGPLKPRYRQVIGAQLDPFGWLKSYWCPDETGFVRKYTRDAYTLGAFISSTRGKSPAEAAGLRCGDVVVGIDDARITEAREMQAAVAAAKGGRVMLTYVRPIVSDIEQEGSRLVTMTRERTVAISTFILDEVAELAALPPIQSGQQFFDTYGPAFDLVTETRFTESAPGVIHYECSLTHRGTQEVVPVASLDLALWGGFDAAPEVRIGDNVLFRLDAPVAGYGIPKLMTFKVRAARRIYQDHYAEYVARYKSHTLVIRGLESHETNWYSWVDVAARCYVPERTAREIERKMERLSSAGIRE